MLARGFNRIALAISIVSFSCISLATKSLADEWNIKEGDQRLTADELDESLVGHQLLYEGGQKSVFRPDGTYEFHVGGEVYEYFYSFTGDGTVCITSSDFGSRCDLIVINSGNYYSINEAGDRYKATLE